MARWGPGMHSKPASNRPGHHEGAPVSMREVGRCRNEPCRQLDLLWEDGYCSAGCREQATGCEVPGCTCAGGCRTQTTPGDQPPTPGGSRMTDPVRVGELVPGVLAEVVDRAGHGYQRWAEQVAQAGYCHHPIRLTGRTMHVDRPTGEVREVYDTAAGARRGAAHRLRQPARVALPVVAATYRADAYQLWPPGWTAARASPTPSPGIRGCS